MATLFVVSVEGGVGKTAVSLGVALSAQQRGLKVGYMKPVSTHLASANGRIVDSDVVLIRDVLKLDAPMEKLCPFLLTGALRTNVMWGEPIDAPSQVMEAFHELAQGVDLMIVEGPTSLHQGITLGLGADKVVEMLDATAVTVVRGEFHDAAEAALLTQNVLGDRLVGAVINSVPEENMPQMRNLIGPFLKSRGMQLLGVMPRNYLPGALTVSELASLLNGRIVPGTGKGDAVVENFSVVVAAADAALRRLSRQADTAVITGSDEPDILYAALDSPARCIVICGNTRPERMAINRAFQRQLPLILAPLDISEATTRIAEARAPVNVNSLDHIERLRGLIDRELQMDSLFETLGLQGHESSRVGQLSN